MWAKQHSDTLMKKNYYPTIKKKNLFKQHYIASRSGHSRGSTVDLTLVNILTNEEIDMGTPYDFFGKESWVNYKGITVEQQQNRKLLQEVMIKHGFRNYLQEWWHFTLNNEPFKNTYFNFDIQ
jgi:D-alanyl-D-alanine dipeptidase